MIKHLTKNIIKIVVRYVRPYELKKFFQENCLSHSMKFSYDAMDCVLSLCELRKLIDFFCNMVLEGAYVELLRDGEVKWLKVGKLRVYRVFGSSRWCFDNLKVLNLSGCENITNLDFLSCCRRMEWLNLSGCCRLRELKGMGNLDVDVLRRLELEKCEKLVGEDVGRIVGRFRRLRYLNLGYVNVADVDFLGECVELRYVDLSYVMKLKNVYSLMKCRKLRVLKMIGCCRVLDMNFLEECKRVRVLWSNRLGMRTSWRNNGDIKLRDLYLHSQKLDDGMARCEGVRNLTLKGYVWNVQYVSFRQLRSLTLIGNNDCSFTMLGNCEWLNSCAQLENLKLIRCSCKISVGKLERLRELRMIKCEGIDYSGLEGCRDLSVIELCERTDSKVRRGCDFLASCVGLRALELNFWPGIYVLRGCRELVYLEFNFGFNYVNSYSNEKLDLSELVMCEKLEVLKVVGSSVKIEGNIGGCRGLRELDVRGVECVVGLEELVGECPNLCVVRSTYYNEKIRKKGIYVTKY